MPGPAEILRRLAQDLDPQATAADLGLKPEDLRRALLAAATLLPKDETAKPAPKRDALIIHTDGASRGNPGPAGAGVAIYAGDRLIEGQAQYLGHATNNQAEYNALLIGLDRALALGARSVLVRADSELIVRQIEGRYKVKDLKLQGLFQRARDKIARLDSFRIEHVPREQNREADRLANRAIDEFERD